MGVRICKPKPKYTPSFPESRLCLRFRKLGQKCFHSFECSKISNAVCYDKNLDELDRIVIFHKRFRCHQVKKADDYQDQPERYGECKCRESHFSFSIILFLRNKYLVFNRFSRTSRIQVKK